MLGETSLTDALHEQLAQRIPHQPRFLHLLARSLRQYEPPLSSFGAFVLESGDNQQETFDIKGVLAQVVDLARLRALQHGIRETGTAERLDALRTAGHLRPESADQLAHDFQFLMDLRLRHQARRLLAHLELDNRIAPGALDASVQKELKSVFAHLKAVQQNLDHEFKGV